MDAEEKFSYFKKRPTEELVGEEKLNALLEEGRTLTHYIGFEISGFAHLGTGLMTSIKVKDLMKAGVKPTIFLADYHTWINRKLGGDLETIQKVAKNYFKHVFTSLGLEEGKVKYILASEMYDNDYWKSVIEIGNNSTINRVKRAMTILGREEDESNPSSFMLYPLMQTADIFSLNVNIAHAGMDQRKVHMLAVDVAEKVGKEKPIALHTHLIPSLKGTNRMDPIAGKMSKSVPDSAIFVHEPEDEIKRKINSAVCNLKETEGNPVFEILKWILYTDDETQIRIERDAKFGGNIEGTLPEIEKLYKEGKIHPSDLKKHVGEKLSEALKPCRAYFEKHKEEVDQIITISR